MSEPLTRAQRCDRLAQKLSAEAARLRDVAGPDLDLRLRARLLDRASRRLDRVAHLIHQREATGARSGPASMAGRLLEGEISPGRDAMGSLDI